MLTVPAIMVGLVDDAAVFPPGSATVAEAVAAHRTHRSAWYASVVGPLLLPTAELASAVPLLAEGERLGVGLIGDLVAAETAAKALPPGIEVRQVEIPVAKRGEDPLPGLRMLLDAAAGPLTGWRCYAEIPLTWGLLSALDLLAQARSGGATAVAAKFRTGGLAAELFPTPAELAAVICACRDRAVPFKLTAGLHHALRHRDRATGFTHHGFLNVLAATLAVDGGADQAEVASLLEMGDPRPLVALVAEHAETDRPLWVGFGSCSVTEPIDDLQEYGLLG